MTISICTVNGGRFDTASLVENREKFKQNQSAFEYPTFFYTKLCDVLLGYFMAIEENQYTQIDEFHLSESRVKSMLDMLYEIYEQAYNIDKSKLPSYDDISQEARNHAQYPIDIIDTLIELLRFLLGTSSNQFHENIRNHILKRDVAFAMTVPLLWRLSHDYLKNIPNKSNVDMALIAYVYIASARYEELSKY